MWPFDRNHFGMSYLMMDLICQIVHEDWMTDQVNREYHRKFGYSDTPPGGLMYRPVIHATAAQWRSERPFLSDKCIYTFLYQGGDRVVPLPERYYYSSGLNHPHAFKPRGDGFGDYPYMLYD